MAGKDTIGFVDFARGYAILTVALMHYMLSVNLPAMVETAAHIGGTGVHLFIFLSGFGLYYGRERPLMEFYKRRFEKVYFPYALFISFVFAFNLFIQLYPGGDIYAFLGHILLYKMFDANIYMSFGGHFWFLSMIICFYLVYPMILRVKKAMDNSQFIVFGAMVSLSWWLFLLISGTADQTILNTFFLQFFWEFCLGMVAADLFINRERSFWKQKRSHLIIVALVGILVMALMRIFLGDEGGVLNDIPAFFGYTALCILIYNLLKSGVPVLEGMVERIGRSSFFLYIVHILPMTVLLLILEDIGAEMSIAHILLLLPAAIGLAFMYQKLLDRILGRPARRDRARRST